MLLPVPAECESQSGLEEKMETVILEILSDAVACLIGDEGGSTMLNAEACSEYRSIRLPGRTSAKQNTLRNLSCLVMLFIVEVMHVPMLVCFVVVHPTPSASVIMEECRRGHAHTQRTQVWQYAPICVV